MGYDITPFQIFMIAGAVTTVLITKIILCSIVWATAHLKGYDRMAIPFVFIGFFTSASILLLVMAFLSTKESDIHVTVTDTDAGQQTFCYCPGCGSRIYPGTVKCPTCRREI